MNDRFLRKCNGFFLKDMDSVNLAIAFLLAYITINDTLSSVPIAGSILHYGIYVFIILVVNALPAIIKGWSKGSILLLWLFTIIWIISYGIAVDTDVHRQCLTTFFRFCFPCFLLARSVTNINDLCKKMRYAALVIVFSTLVSLILGSNRMLTLAYSQDMGYEMLIPFIVFVLYTIMEEGKWNVTCAVISFMLILMCGARGPLLCAIIGFVLCCFFCKTLTVKKVIALLIGAGVLIAFLSLFYVDVLTFLMRAFDSLGMSTRTISGLLSKEIGNDSSRARLRAFAWNYAKQHICVGTGFINDRRLIYDSITVSTQKTVAGYYCHNFFLELMMQFGLIPGLMVVVAFLYALIHKLLCTAKKHQKAILILFVVIGFLPLLVSRSYLTHYCFYLLIGYMFSFQKIRTIE